MKASPHTRGKTSFPQGLPSGILGNPFTGPGEFEEKALVALENGPGLLEGKYN